MMVRRTSRGSASCTNERNQRATSRGGPNYRRTTDRIKTDFCAGNTRVCRGTERSVLDGDAGGGRIRRSGQSDQTKACTRAADRGRIGWELTWPLGDASRSSKDPMSTRAHTRLLRFAYWLIVGPFTLLAVLTLLPIQYVLNRIERSRWPRTVDQAVDRLMNSLSEDDKNRIAADDPEVDWYSLGQSIRNGYGLWQGNTELLASCGVLGEPLAADTGSGIIIAALQRRIHGIAATSRPT